MVFDLYAVAGSFVVKVAQCLIGLFFRCFFFLRRLRLQSLSSDESEFSLEDGSDESSFLFLRRFFFLSHLFFFDDESDDDGSRSGSSGTCSFSFFSENSVGRVSSSKSVDHVSGFSCNGVTKSVCRVSGIFLVFRSKTYLVSSS